MYELPDGILSYIFIEQSLIYGALAGLFIVPFWFLGLFVLFSLWQADLWEEQQEVISFLQNQGFEVSCRSIRPVVSLYTSDTEICLTGTPFGCWAQIKKTGEKKKRVSISKEKIAEIIGLLVPSESISIPQNF